MDLIFVINSERIEENDKLVEMKQIIIDQQEGVIKLMRNLNDPSTFINDKQYYIETMLNDMFLKYDEAKQRIQNSEVI